LDADRQEQGDQTEQYSEQHQKILSLISDARKHENKLINRKLETLENNIPYHVFLGNANSEKTAPKSARDREITIGIGTGAKVYSSISRLDSKTKGSIGERMRLLQMCMDHDLS
jgi:hypothetical protein